MDRGGLYVAIFITMPMIDDNSSVSDQISIVKGIGMPCKGVSIDAH